MNSKAMLAGIVAAGAVLSWNCYETRIVNQRVLIAPEYLPMRLTVELIDEFGISRSKLEQLCFYLENTLLLQFVWQQGSSRVAGEFELDLDRQIELHEIQFQHLAKGKAVTVLEEVRIVDFCRGGSTLFAWVSKALHPTG